ncbi:MAG: hypothetical protein ACTHNG_10220 [Ginsengibacter sp.]
MEDLIASFIAQSKDCRLRDVGRFKVIDNPARADVANKQMLPPSQEITFSPREEKLSDGLVKYVSEQKRIAPSEAMEQLKRWCSEARDKLKKGEEINFYPLGVLKKGTSGNEFVRDTSRITNFFESINAERVIHENAEHEMLVGDKQTTSSVMSHFYEEEESTGKNNTWKIIGIILLIIAFFLLFLHFYANPFSVKTIGNQQKVVPAVAPKTYTTP